MAVKAHVRLFNLMCGSLYLRHSRDNRLTHTNGLRSPSAPPTFSFRCRGLLSPPGFNNVLITYYLATTDDGGSGQYTGLLLTVLLLQGLLLL